MQGPNAQMAFFDPYLFSDARSDEDLANLAFFGTTHVVTCAHAPRRFDHADQLHRYFQHLLRVETQRLRDAQLEPYIALGVHPRAAPSRPLHTLWPRLEALVADPHVVALGELGWVDATPEEYALLETQLALAVDLNLPALIRLPVQPRRPALLQLLACLRRTGLDVQRVMITNPDAELLPRILDAGLAVALQPRFAKVGMDGLVDALQQSSWETRLCLSAALTEGPADVLAIRQAVDQLRQAGLNETCLARLSRDNADEFFGLRQQLI